MKKLIAIILFAVSAAQAGDYQHQSALLGICKMQAKMGMMIAHAKKTGEPSAVNVAMFRDGDPGLYELTINTERIALENADMSLQFVAERVGMWCLDNAESIIYKHRR